MDSLPPHVNKCHVILIFEMYSSHLLIVHVSRSLQIVNIYFNKKKL